MRASKRIWALAVILLIVQGCRIDLSISGNGSVETLSGTFACDSSGGDCTEEYAAPASEVFIADPLPGHTLAFWSGCVYRDIASCDITVTQEGIDRGNHFTISAGFRPLDSPIEDAVYSYNALGQRVSKTVGGTTTLFVYDTQGRLLAELDSEGRPLREHIRLEGVPIAQVTTTSDGSEATHYVHTDHLGTPKLLTDRFGITRWAHEATPFGDTIALYEEVTYNLRFPGQYADRESGLNYNNFRDYDPALGRYTQPDPIGLVGGTGMYAYANANPLRYHDTWGLYCISDEGIAALAGAVSGTVAGGITAFINSGGNPLAAAAGAGLGGTTGAVSGLVGQMHGRSHLGVGVGAGIAGAATSGTARGAAGALVGGAISGLGKEALDGVLGSGAPIGAVSGLIGGMISSGPGGALGGTLGGYLGGALADAIKAGNDCEEECD